MDRLEIFGQELSFPCRTVVYLLRPDLSFQGVCAYSCRIVELAKVAKPEIFEYELILLVEL